MSMGGRMQVNGTGGAGIPDNEGSSEAIDPALMAAIMAGALPGGPMGMAGPPCPGRHPSLASSHAASVMKGELV